MLSLGTSEMTQRRTSTQADHVGMVSTSIKVWYMNRLSKFQQTVVVSFAVSQLAQKIAILWNRQATGEVGFLVGCDHGMKSYSWHHLSKPKETAFPWHICCVQGDPEPARMKAVDFSAR